MKQTRIIIILLIFLTASMHGACRHHIASDFFAHTVDEIYWKGTKYMCGFSPLSPLNGYGQVYKDYTDCDIDYGIPMVADKNYAAFWTIIDSMLYLYDMDLICTTQNRLKPDPANMEKFLNATFSKNLLPKSDRKDERYKNGVIPAVWFTGTLYVKRFPQEEKGEAFWKEEYRDEKHSRLKFDKGRLTEERLVSVENPSILLMLKEFYTENR
jgi:hypothetical protein